jgi:hypothetical protein
LDISEDKQLAVSALKPVTSFVFWFHGPNQLNLFLNLTNHLPKTIEQTHSSKLVTFSEQIDMDCVSQSVGLQRLKSVAWFALTLTNKNPASLRQTLSIWL